MATHGEEFAVILRGHSEHLIWSQYRFSVTSLEAAKWQLFQDECAGYRFSWAAVESDSGDVIAHYDGREWRCAQ